MNPNFVEIMALICSQSVDDAAAFFEEFGETLDPATTDWDGLAWADLQTKLRVAHGVTDETLDLIQPVYSHLLALMTHFMANEAAAIA